MKQYNFNEIILREGTNSIKYDGRSRFFNTDDIIPLWVADTDFKTPDFIVNAIKMRANHEIYGYTFRPESYFDAIVSWMQKRHNWQVDRNWISFSPGVVSGIVTAIETFSNPGDGVIIQPPVYFPFFECVKGTDRRLVENPLKIVDGRYTFDFDDLLLKIDKGCKLFLLCNPHNPGGMVWTREELERLSEICLENNIMVISDEIHSDLIFEGYSHIPFPSLSTEAADNSIVCTAPSKTFNIAGLSSSIVIIPNRANHTLYEKAIKNKHLGMGNIFGSVAVEAAYSKGERWLNELMDYLRANYLLIDSFFKTHLPEAKVMKPEATFLVWIDFRKYGMNDSELSKFITTHAKVGLNNGARFGIEGDGWMRLNFGCPRTILEEALNRLKSAFAQIKPV